MNDTQHARLRLHALQPSRGLAGIPAHAVLVKLCTSRLARQSDPLPHGPRQRTFRYGQCMLSQINTLPSRTFRISGLDPVAGHFMKILLKEMRQNPLLWMLVFVPAVLVAERIAHSAHTLLFVLAVLAIVPLASLLSHATEAVAEKTGDAIGGLLSATLGNLTELIIALTALH